MLNQLLEPQEHLSTHDVASLIQHEARLLDERRWDDWLDMYAQDAQFWLPAWRDEATLTDDPETELSLIYYDNCDRLRERVWRLRSGLSLASKPLPRTLHSIGYTAFEPGEDGAMNAKSSWTCHIYDPRWKTSHVLFGFYEHRVVSTGDRLVIKAKKITLMNDHIPSLVDVFYI